MTTTATARPPVRPSRSARRVPASRVYRVLANLEDAGWVTSAWESPEPLSRPRRRFYRLTPEGRAGALRMLGLTEGAQQ